MLRKKDINIIQKSLAELDAARDSVFEASRVSVRFSGRAIIELHRGDLEKASEHIENAARSIKDLERILKKWRDLKTLGNVTLAYQEYAEARLLYGIVAERRLLSLREVGVEVQPYLLGLLDFIGELRRFCLNHLRSGRVAEAEYSLKVMEETFEDLYLIDHTAIIENFRHKMDNARKLIEATRGDVVSEVRRLSLEKVLRDFEDKLLKKLKS
ncbi:MAG: haloacid dehalogenase [Candidatus Bathyarchaeia archaeon]|nr:haloacid dehalogenase [Candidatus Bathyarchaeota archaeon]